LKTANQQRRVKTAVAERRVSGGVREIADARVDKKDGGGGWPAIDPRDKERPARLTEPWADIRLELIPRRIGNAPARYLGGEEVLHIGCVRDQLRRDSTLCDDKRGGFSNKRGMKARLKKAEPRELASHCRIVVSCRDLKSRRSSALAIPFNQHLDVLRLLGSKPHHPVERRRLKMERAQGSRVADLAVSDSDRIPGDALKNLNA
jgi:hypothetical protein